ncbi:hypothetical protein BH23GEM3_BH23GEM3_03830 [soil metagenome]|nr:hypothetical protein [Gemmatimonadota bacterium]
MRLTFTRAALTILLAFFGTACASPSGGASTGAQSQANVLTTAQIQESTASNAYDAVRALRPRWLQKRGSQSILLQEDIVVYYDNVRLGAPESLRSIPATGILRMQFIDATSATQRWGTGHSHGAILVTTRS